MKRRVEFALILLAVLFAAPRSTTASCIAPSQPLCATWQDYDAVFDGTVTEIREIELPDRYVPQLHGRSPALVPHRLITFRVHDQWKGVSGATVQMLLHGGEGYTSSNDFHVQLGARYLIFGRRFDGYLTTSSCDPSSPHGNAAKTIAMLNSFRQRARGGTIAVTAHRAYSPLNPDYPKRPFEATVALVGPVRREVLVREGSTEFTELPVGTYTLTASAKEPNLTENPPVTIEIPHLRACGSAMFHFGFDSSVAGQVRTSDGGPVRTMVELAPEEHFEKEGTRRAGAYPDEYGFFVFRNVPPGRYVLVLNSHDQVSSTGHPRTVYPGPRSSPEIEVRAGEKLSLGAWQVPPPLPELKLNLRLTDSVGRPLVNREVNLLDVTSPSTPDYARHVMGKGTSGGGLVEFAGRGTRRYVIRTAPVGEKEMVEESDPFSAEDAAKGITVRLRPARPFRR